MGPRSRIRCAALLAAAALTVHELRYLIAYGGGADAALGRQGHGYLSFLAPAVIGLLVLAAAEALHRFLRAPVVAEGPRWRTGHLWLLASVLLIGIYVGQETIEGLADTGHPTGLGGVVGHGGWLAFPGALLVALLLALAFRARSAARALLRAAPVRLTVGPAPEGFATGRSVPRILEGTLALHLAGRAPPVLS